MNDTIAVKLLFIINPNSGNNSINFTEEIQKYFEGSHHHIDLYELPSDCSSKNIRDKIAESRPDKIIAVGGDGTIKLVAEHVLKSGIPLGIIPAGSANGMAKELNIPLDLKEALDIILNGEIKKIHITRVNNEICIHLGDIGFNALVVKKFETAHKRGMWEYIKAGWKVLKLNPLLSLTLEFDNETIRRKAAMVVIANATKYGTGVIINPKGSMEDELFEVIVVKKFSLKELFKMRFTHAMFDPDKTELFQTSSLKIHSKHTAHFQVDGEYLGKVNTIKASILPDALNIIVPKTE